MESKELAIINDLERVKLHEELMLSQGQERRNGDFKFGECLLIKIL